jgi:hypothetical protein
MEAVGQGQRQDSLDDQLRDLILIANQHGMYDAADYLTHVIEKNYDSLYTFKEE